MSSLREEIACAYREAMKARQEVAVSTIRLIQAALKDRDIAARGKGDTEGVREQEVLGMLSGMIREREETIPLYEQGGRAELAAREREEIEVIRRFLPEPLTRSETLDAIQDAIRNCEAAQLKDMGRVMSLLRERFPGRIDMREAGEAVRARLG